MTSALAPTPPEDAPDAERRTGLRALSILRVARLEIGETDQLCVIRNISAGGVMFESMHPPAIGERVTVELRSDKRMPGITRWSRDGKTGIEFDRQIDVEQMLREDRSPLLRVRPRAPRFVRRGQVRLIVEGESIAAEIVDLSVGGVSCRPELPVARGVPLVAALDGVGATNAEIRWVRGDLVGLKYEKPLPWRALQCWLDQAPRD